MQKKNINEIHHIPYKQFIIKRQNSDRKTIKNTTTLNTKHNHQYIKISEKDGIIIIIINKNVILTNKINLNLQVKT